MPGGLIDKKQDAIDTVNDPKGDCVNSSIDAEGQITYSYANKTCKERAQNLQSELNALKSERNTLNEQISAHEVENDNLSQMIKNWNNNPANVAEKLKLATFLDNLKAQIKAERSALGNSEGSLGHAVYRGGVFQGYFAPATSKL